MVLIDDFLIKHYIKMWFSTANCNKSPEARHLKWACAMAFSAIVLHWAQRLLLDSRMQPIMYLVQFQVVRGIRWVLRSRYSMILLWWTTIISMWNGKERLGGNGQLGCLPLTGADTSTSVNTIGGGEHKKSASLRSCKWYDTNFTRSTFWSV